MVWEEAMASTGIQGFWNYDVFSLLGPMSGRPQAEAMGFVNTWNLNLCFTQTDIVMKFHNNPPFITRTYNSKVDQNDPNFRAGISLVGKDWMMNYEHCLVEVLDGEVVTDVYEIDPTRCMNHWTYSGGIYSPPNGVLKEMTKSSGEYNIETKDHFTYHFVENTNIIYNPANGNKFYVLQYIEDRNNVRVYVDWEDMSATAYDDRIRAIQVSLDQGSNKDDVIKFEYSDDEPNLVESYRLVPIEDTNPPGWILDMRWDFTYDGNSNLTKVTYPSGSQGNRNYYSFDYATDEFTINDMEGTKHFLNWDGQAPEKLEREIWVKDGGSYWSRTTYQQNMLLTTTITDPDDASDIWSFVHDANGLLASRTDPESNVYEYEWTGDYQLQKITYPSDDYTYFTYNGDLNLSTVRWYDDSISDYNDSYKVAYTYGSDDSKNDTAKIEMDSAFNNPNYFTVTEYEYDSNHNVTLVTAGLNPDSGKDMTNPQEADIAAQTTYTYSDEGNVESIEMPEGNRTEFTYESDITEGQYGRLVKIEQFMGGELEGSGPGMGFGVPGPSQITILKWNYFDFRLKFVSTIGEDSGSQSFSYTNIGEQWKTSVSGGGTNQILYDDMSNPITLISPDGNATIVDYDLETTPLNLPCKITSPSPNSDENSTTLTYKKNGDISIRTYKHNGIDYDVTYTYDDARRLTNITSEVDPLATPTPTTEETEFGYDSNGNLVSVKDNGDNETTYYYNFVNQVVKIACAGDDGSGSPTRWERVLFEYVGPMGLISTITYKWGSLSANEASTNYYFDRLGRVVEVIQPEVSYNPTYSFSTLYYYDRNSNVVYVVNRKVESDGETTTISDRTVTYKYDGFNRLIKLYTEYDGESTTDSAVHYDAYGNMVESTVNGLETTRMDYDSHGRVTAIYKPGEDPSLGRQYEYDVRTGRVLKITGSGGFETSVTYNPDGSVATVTDSAGRTYRREFYENGWLKRIIYPSGNSIGYSYDGLGRITHVYESVPELDSSVTDDMLPFGTTENTAITLSMEYTWVDVGGGKKELKVTYSTFRETGEDDYETRYYFDARGRLAKVEFYVGECGTPGWYDYTYEYDGRGNIETVKFDGNTIISNTYNGLNQLTQQAFDTTTNNFKYCCCSLLKAEQSDTANLFTRNIEFTYDKLHRLTNEKYTDGITVQVESEPIISRVIKEFEYAYDNASRLIRIKDPYYGESESDPLQTRFVTDEDSNTAVVERTDTSNPVKGNAETYNHTFDEAGRIKSIDLPDSTQSGEHVANQAVLRIEYGYHDTGDLASTKVKTIFNESEIYYIGYSFNADRKMTEKVVKHSSTDTGWLNWAIFNYDGRGQLIEEKYTYCGDGSTINVLRKTTYEYDLGGNVTSREMEISDAVLTYSLGMTYSKGYQLTLMTVQDNDDPQHTWIYTPTYDSKGNLIIVIVSNPAPIADPPFLFPSGTMTYDNFNHLTCYGDGVNTWYISYDSLGRVFRKADSDGIAPGSATHYYYAAGGLAQEYDETINVGLPVDDLEFDYLRGLGGGVLRGREIDGSDTDRPPVRDRIGSAMNLCKPEGDRMDAAAGYVFDAWGESFNPGGGGSQPSSENHIRFHGAFAEDFLDDDDTSGIYRMGARHYSTVLGRFFQRDPLILCMPPNSQYPLSVNPYIYALNRPTYMTDALGWCATCGPDVSGGSYEPMPARPGTLPPELIDDLSGWSSKYKPCGRSYGWPLSQGWSAGGGVTPGPMKSALGNTALECHEYMPVEHCCPEKQGEELDKKDLTCCCVYKGIPWKGDPFLFKLLEMPGFCCRYIWNDVESDPDPGTPWSNEQCNIWCCDMETGSLGDDCPDCPPGGGILTRPEGGRGPVVPTPPPFFPRDPWNQPSDIDPGFSGSGRFPKPDLMWWQTGVFVVGLIVSAHTYGVCRVAPKHSDCFKFCCCPIYDIISGTGTGVGLLGLLGKKWFKNPGMPSFIGIVTSAISAITSIAQILCWWRHCRPFSVFGLRE